MKKNLFLITLFVLFSCQSNHFDLNKDEIFSEANDRKEFYNEDGILIRVDAMSPWWTGINDEVFEEYVEEMFKNNYSFQGAYETMIQAKENYNIARGGFWPSISTNTSAKRSITPTNSLGFGLGGANKIYNTNYTVDIAASWQLDFFGKIKNSTKAARKNYEASKYDVEALKHSLIAELFKSKISIALYRDLLELSKDNNKDKQDIYGLVKRRYDLGVGEVSLDNVYEAKNNWNRAKVDVSTYDKALEAEIYLFESLLGRLPNISDLDLEDFDLVDLPQEVLACVSAGLVDRRPDLRSLRLKITAANADVKVAIADLYPDVSISASTGFSGNKSSELINLDQLASSLTGNIATKIFQGGALRSKIRLKKSALKEKVATYVGGIVDAVVEVETLLKNEAELKKEFAARVDSESLLNKNTLFKQRRYEKGIENLQSYLLAKEVSYNSKRDLLLKWQERWNNRVNLYLALGGDWDKFNECEE